MMMSSRSDTCFLSRSTSTAVLSRWRWEASISLCSFSFSFCRTSSSTLTAAIFRLATLTLPRSSCASSLSWWISAAVRSQCVCSTSSYSPSICLIHSSLPLLRSALSLLSLSKRPSSSSSLAWYSQCRSATAFSPSLASFSICSCMLYMSSLLFCSSRLYRACSIASFFSYSASSSSAAAMCASSRLRSTLEFSASRSSRSLFSWVTWRSKSSRMRRFLSSRSVMVSRSFCSPTMRWYSASLCWDRS
mmetsp:Transcript_29694/g.95444  ORF Transcript_29694/g.95444 Transcript_29694/m.95444 type:complete len:247 (+) Transcript_29694:679-1419(+)